MTTKKVISREEVLGGLRGKSIKQANTLLTLIKNRTARLVAQSQPPVSFILAETSLKERDQAFLQAIAIGRESPLQPTIQDIERYASHWATLVPDDPSIRATVANLLAKKYHFTNQTVPDLRLALGLDNEAVQQAYQRLYSQPLSTIYAPHATLGDGWRWAWAAISRRLETMPPFWLACILTVIIGAVTLALPIAIAGVGPLPGIVLIVLIGLINMITVAAMAETVSRSGNIRYGNAFIGRVVADYLGNTSSALLSIVLAAFSFGLLLVFYIGISTTLEDTIGLPAEAWMILLFLIGLYFLSRGSLNATLALTIVIGLINISLLLTLSLLALTRWRIENFLYINLPLLNGQPFDPTVWSTLIGVILGVYSSHILVIIFGKMLLQRDPTGQAVVKGHAAGIGLAIILNVIWILAVGGAVAPHILTNQTGTVLAPLTAEIGPVLGVLGAIFVIVSMGLGLVQFSLALFNLARERLEAQRAIMLGRQGRFLASLSPVIVVFLVAEWLSITGSGSFAGILGFLGVMVDSLMAGIFPVLLLTASRRKGELVPKVVYRFLGNRLLVTGIYLLFLFNLLFHGLVIWQNPVQQAGGILVGLLMLGVTIGMIRRGAFAPRIVVELRREVGEQASSRAMERASFSILVRGQPAPAEVRLGYIDGERHLQTASGEIPAFTTLCYAHFHVPVTEARELKVWAHQVTPEGDSVSLPGQLVVHYGQEKKEFDLTLAGTGGQVVLPLNGEACQIELKLSRE